MQVLETMKTIEDNYTYITLSCGNKEAYFAYNHEINQLQIICMNASHKAFRGHGKFFNTFDDALKNYKSSEMKAMIESVKYCVVN